MNNNLQQKNNAYYFLASICILFLIIITIIFIYSRQNFNSYLLQYNSSIITNDNKTYYFLAMLIVLVLFIVTMILIYSRGNYNSSQLQGYSLLSLIITGIVLMALIYFKFPEFFKNILFALSESSYLLILILYIFFLIILYQNILSTDQIKKYAYFILPITILLGIALFYLNIKSVIENINRVYQSSNDIKCGIIYFCLILFMFLFYYFNPNNYISQYFGPYLVITILLLSFGLLYLMSLFAFPIQNDSNGKSSKTLSLFNPFTIFSIVSFMIFIILIISGIISFPGGFSNSDKGTQTEIFILIILVCIFWIISFVLSILNGTNTNTTNYDAKNKIFNYGNIFRNSLLLLFGLTFSGLLIYWLVVGVQNLTNASSIAAFVLNLIIILVILVLVFKIISSTSTYQNSGLIQKIINGILYIPSLILSVITGAGNLSGNVAPNENVTIYYIYLGIILLALITYFIYPYVVEKITDQGGLLLINQPIYLTEPVNIASYHALNPGTSDYDYNYALSFWVYFDSSYDPSKSDNYISIINYGNKPNILYNQQDNSLVFIMNTTNPEQMSNFTLTELEDNGNRILYKHNNVLLQKWTHIIINYNSGTLDIFINGQLMKSDIGTIPYMSLDVLQIGAFNGIHGGICNMNYFKNPLDIQKIYYLYNLIKDKTPPVHSSSTDTIINVLEQIPNVSNKSVEISNSTSYTDKLVASMDSTKQSINSGLSNIDVNISDQLVKNINNFNNNNFLSMEWYFKNNKY